MTIHAGSLTEAAQTQLDSVRQGIFRHGRTAQPQESREVTASPLTFTDSMAVRGPTTSTSAWPGRPIP